MDLESISADQTFDDLTRQHARGLRTKLIQKNNQAFFHMALDILNSLKMLSTFLQSSAGTLIGKNDAIKNLKLTLNKRITEVTNAKYGKFELAFYDECTCVINDGGAIRRRKCTTDDLYDRADSIEYKGVTLSSTGNILLDRKACIEAILIQVDEYFAGRNLADFDVFLPPKIPSESGSTLNYGLVSIRNLASALGFSRELIIDQWQLLLQKMIETTEFLENRKAHPLHFWSKMLATESLPWSKEIKTFIRTILVLPIGSADAERGFSILKHARYDRRSSLVTDTLDAILRLRINGPNIEEFDALKYAKLWEQAGKMLTDAPGGASEESMETQVSAVEEELDEADESELISGMSRAKHYLAGSVLF